MFKKVLIANRGEIAVRVIRACRELGIKTVAVYSTADKNALHVQLADEAYCIGPIPSKDSYLNMTNLMSVATSTGADAIHPGYGFLAENADFAEICAACNITFIGPDPQAMIKMGDKNIARDTMKNAGVPIVPGTDDLIEDIDEAIKIANEAGYPVIIKATAGGGGKGMRVARDNDELITSVRQAQKEAQAAFGNAGVYLEKCLKIPAISKFKLSLIDMVMFVILANGIAPFNVVTKNLLKKLHLRLLIRKPVVKWVKLLSMQRKLLIIMAQVQLSSFLTMMGNSTSWK